MPTCKKCSSHFPNKLKINGKFRNLQNRKFCLSCSPFKGHNTLDLNNSKSSRNLDSKTCPKCKQEKKRSEYYKRSDVRLSAYCKECTNKDTSNRQRHTKEKAVQYKGGKCERCGYSNCIAALEFHHLNPLEKDADWSILKLRNFDSLKAELDKCIILCSNCHREEHYN